MLEHMQTCILILRCRLVTVHKPLPGVCKAGSGFRKHLLLILVHVYRIRPCWLGLWVGIDLARPQPPGIIRGVI